MTPRIAAWIAQSAFSIVGWIEFATTANTINAAAEAVALARRVVTLLITPGRASIAARHAVLLALAMSSGNPVATPPTRAGAAGEPGSRRRVLNQRSTAHRRLVIVGVYLTSFHVNRSATYR